MCDESVLVLVLLSKGQIVAFLTCNMSLFAISVASRCPTLAASLRGRWNYFVLTDQGILALNENKTQYWFDLATPCVFKECGEVSFIGGLVTGEDQPCRAELGSTLRLHGALRTSFSEEREDCFLSLMRPQKILAPSALLTLIGISKVSCYGMHDRCDMPTVYDRKTTSTKQQSLSIVWDCDAMHTHSLAHMLRLILLTIHKVDTPSKPRTCKSPNRNRANIVLCEKRRKHYEVNQPTTYDPAVTAAKGTQTAFPCNTYSDTMHYSTI